MDFKSLQDLIALAQTGSFSKAAERRFVTQPAFSRRIKNLEVELGANLVDRSHYPTRLTAEGEVVLRLATRVSDELNQCKQDLSELDSGTSGQLVFSMPHVLSIGFFPHWRTSIENRIGDTRVKVITGNIHDTAQLLDAGGCDFVLFYRFELLPSYSFEDARFETVMLAEDRLIPVCSPDTAGIASITLDSDTDELLPYIGWSAPTLVNHVLKEWIRTQDLETRLKERYQNQLAAALREEILAGNGFGWLPASLIENDLGSGRLVRASAKLDVPMNISIACSPSNLTEKAREWWNMIQQDVSANTD